MRNKVALGIDIGGTNTKFGLVDRQGKCYLESSISTTAPGEFPAFIDALFAAVEREMGKLEEEFEIVAVGCGAPNGNFYKGTIEFAPNLKWKGVVEVAKALAEKTGVPAWLTNDANAAAIGEMVYGGAKGMKDFIIITLGTGLGSGIVVNGELVYGHDGFAGEIGHTIAVREGRDCGCGRKGCLETYASATGLRRTVFELMCTTNLSSSLRSVPFDDMTSAMIYKAATEGDQLAQRAFAFTGEILGRALADSIAHLSPEAIFLFGGLAKAGDLILLPTVASMEANLLNIFKNKVKVLPSSLDEDRNAAVAGAAALAWNELEKLQLA